jgi:hypothetical protein
MRLYSSISRAEATRIHWHRIAVRSDDGETVVGMFTLPAGVRNGQKIRLSNARLEERTRGEHEWPPDGVLLRIRMPNWRLRNGVVAFFVLAGLIGGAPPYSGLLAVLCPSAGAMAADGRALNALPPLTGLDGGSDDSTDVTT